MSFLLQNESARQHCLQLLQVVISVVTHLVSNSDNHQLKFVDLADWLGSWRRLSSYRALSGHGTLLALNYALLFGRVVY